MAARAGAGAGSRRLARVTTPNERLSAFLNAQGLTTFEVARSAFLLEDERGRLLVMRSDAASFPTTCIGEAWQLPSSGCYAGDLWDMDVMALGGECVTYSTSLVVPPLTLVGVAVDQQSTLWADRWAQDVEPRTTDATILHLYFHARVEAAGYALSGDFFTEGAWLDPEPAVDRLEVACDQAAVRGPRADLLAW
jgi:hypothetical protein